MNLNRYKNTFSPLISKILFLKRRKIILEGTKNIILECERESKVVDLEKEIENFKNSRLYYPVTVAAAETGLRDEYALAAAEQINKELCRKFLNKGPSRSGGDSDTAGIVESRHVMMSTFIFSELGLEFGSIVEIGGGYGNWVRLAENIVNYKSWTIIDVPFVKKLQQWFLSREIQNLGAVNLISTEELGDWLKKFQKADLVIGAHSLSELAWKDFEYYYEKIIRKSRYLFYATHVNRPSRELVNLKLTKISRGFKEVKTLMSESNNVINRIYINLNVL